MVTELETIMIYLQRRYNILREIGRLTDELTEAIERRDMISAGLIMEMRGEQMERHAACEGELMQTTEKVPELRKELYQVAFGSIEHIPDTLKGCQDEKEVWIRQKIYEIRSHTHTLIEEIRSRDDRITRKVKQKR